jgi:hypothetical protein
MAELKRTRQSVVAAWVAVVFAISGALMLYPIGAPALNCIFVIVKICMVSGLLVYIFSGNPRVGFVLWTVASVVAVVMTAIKWGSTVSLNAWNVILYVGSMVVDLGMPALVHHLSESKA